MFIRRATSMLVSLLLLMGLAPGRTLAAPAELPGFGDILVDGAREQVFVSSGIAGSSITVFDFDGTVVGTITGASGANAMVLENGLLYVLLGNDAAVDVIDAASLERIDRIDVPAPSAPSYMVQAADKLWFGTGECSQWDSKLASLDPATGVVETFLDPSNGSYYCPAVAAAPGNPGTILVWEAGLSPATIQVFDVSTGVPQLVASKRTDLGNLQDISVNATGDTFYTASGAPYEIDGWRVSDLTKVSRYPTGPYPTAIEVSGDGTRIAAGLNAPYDPDLFIFDVEDSTPTFQFDFGSDAGSVLPGGIDLSPDGRLVFAVIGDHTTTPRLRVMSANTKPTTLDISVSDKRVAFGGSVTVTARLGSNSNVVGQKVSIYSSGPGRERKLIKTGAVDQDGRLSIRIDLKRSTVFSATYEGDVSKLASASNETTVRVGSKVSVKFIAPQGKVGRFHLYDFGQQPIARASIAPNKYGGIALFVLQLKENGRWHTISSASIDIQSDSTAHAQVLGGGSPHPYRARAEYAGDADNLGSKSKWIYLKYNFPG